MSNLIAKEPAQCCTIGVKHEGKSAGSKIKLSGGQDAYIGEPSASNKKDAALLYLPDVFGIWSNSELMVDQFAANGYYTILPDLFNGDPVPVEKPKDFDLGKWLNHGTNGNNPHLGEPVDKIVLSAVEHLKSKGFKKIGALGYCYGAKCVMGHFKNGIDVGFIAHPSFVSEEELAAIKGPLAIAAAEHDNQMGAEQRHKAEEILAKTGKPYQITLYGGVSHGFAVRCDLSIKHERFAKEQAFCQAVSFMNTYLD